MHPRRSSPVTLTRLLDVLFAVSLLGVALSSVYVAIIPAPSTRVRWTLGWVLGGVLVLLWWWRKARPGHGRAVTVVFALVATAIAVVGDNVLSMLPLFCAILLLALDLGPVAAVSPPLIIVAAQPPAMLLIADASPGDAVVQTTATATVLTFIVSFALVLRRSVADTAVREALLAERDGAYTELAGLHEQLRRNIDTEKELVLAQERARAARELHDGLGHRLTVITMSLDFALRSHHRDPERAWTEVQSARVTAKEAIDDMRLWVRALNPVRVAGLEGTAALDAVAQSFRGTGLDVRLTVDGDERPLPEDALLFCHRFVQEGLTNVLRHAKARVVRIALTYEDAAVTIALSDDGDAVGDVPWGFGLRSLDERARHLGGAFSVEPGVRGVVLSATVPTTPATTTTTPTAGSDDDARVALAAS